MKHTLLLLFCTTYFALHCQLTANQDSLALLYQKTIDLREKADILHTLIWSARGQLEFVDAYLDEAEDIAKELETF